ncbi:MAG: ATP-binding protein [Acidobacteriota bacterium]|jgi:signal transduction histidine kinase
MKLVTKLVLGFALLLTLSVAAGWYLLRVVDRLHEDNRRLTEISFRVVDLTREIRATLDVLGEFSEKYLALGGDREYYARLEQYRAEIGADMARLRTLGVSEAEARELDRLDALWRSYLDAIPPREREILREPSGRTGGRLPAPSADRLAELGSELARRLADHLGRLDAQLGAVLEASRRTMESRIATSAADARRAAWTGRVAAVVSLLAATALALGIVVSVRRPLERLTRGTRTLARGDFSHRVPVAGSRELAALAEDFNAMAARLGELDRLKQDFVAGVSHDLKAPLASIEETNRFLLEELAGPLEPRQRKMVELNLQASERLSAMIRDLLHQRRFESGELEYDVAPQRLRELIEAAVGEVVRLRAGPEPSIEIDVEGDPVVDGDRSLLLQVFRNLLANAVKFTPPGGRLGVRLRPDRRSGALVEVWDTGPGVPDELKDRIFERFQRGDPEGRGRQGTGLGLAIAQAIVRGHGGDIRLEDREGGGSRFVVRLPASPPPGSSVGRR